MTEQYNCDVSELIIIHLELFCVCRLEIPSDKVYLGLLLSRMPASHHLKQEIEQHS